MSTTTMNFLRFSLQILIACVVALEAKVFTECELAQKLSELNFPKQNIPGWVCTAKSVSGLDTNYYNKTGDFQSFGLFKLDNEYACQLNQKGNECKARCDSLKGDDITEAAKCALKLFETFNFMYWKPTNDHCTSQTTLTGCSY
ncbi:lysozyme c-1-like [Cimex lectularius]|uniref:lysozyme n=1 Tax=Cimex lectularius TaxID=79782 RepID=A0A8I6S109_CIMLE|nr:lysozyme c-1-like [Cimex lectularius]